jgi:Sortase domain
MTDSEGPARSRILPALLTALGVMLLAVGLLSYTAPVSADPVGPTPGASAGPPTDEPLITLPPLSSVAPSASPSAAADRVSTRVRIAALGIDLPVVPPSGDASYPLCDVAMWIDALGQPGQGRATYLYAHARQGMFLPLLDQSKIQNGKKMIGMVVEVWTSDDQRFLYEITEIRRHQTDLDDAANADHEQLWLQTSEGPKGTVGKLQVVAEYLSQETSDHAAAHPKARPVACD